MYNKVSKIFKILIKKNGDQKWWPIDKEYHHKNNSDPRFEIIAGTILTQNTSWLNVEKSLFNLKEKKLLDIKKILDIDIQILKKLIRSSGFYNQKAERLKNFTSFFYYNYNDFDLYFNRELNNIRNELLSLKGIGPETADSILLYAGNKPTFVIDAYTRRVCNRLPIKVNNSYNDIKKKIENSLKKDYSNEEIIKVYQEFHALIVLLCKNFCKKKPECQRCVLSENCEFEMNYDNKI